MNHLIALLVGSGIGTVFGIAMIALIHRRIWGHWRFWIFESKTTTPVTPIVNLQEYRTMPNPASRSGLAIMHMTCTRNIAHIRNYDYWDDLNRLIRQHDLHCDGEHDVA